MLTRNSFFLILGQGLVRVQFC